jgi:hypothetical protein
VVEVAGFGELTDLAPVAVTAVVARVFMHGSSDIPGLQSQTVDVPDAGPLLAGEDAGEVAADEHAAVRRVAASSPPATAAKRETWCFATDLDRQVTCISVIRCSVPLDGH